MIDSTDAAPPVPSERMRLARIARDAALGVPGVIGTDAGPSDQHVSVGSGQRIEGVVCVAAREGGYEVSLRLVAALAALPRLGEEVRCAVIATASLAGMSVVRVDVFIAEVAGPQVT